MGLIHLPRVPANDNEERQLWTCLACNNGAFLLQFEEGRTSILCAICNIDVTQHVVPSLSEIEQCRP